MDGSGVSSEHRSIGEAVTGIGCLHPLGDLENEFNMYLKRKLQTVLAPENFSYEHLRIQPVRTIMQYIRLVDIEGHSGRTWPILYLQRNLKRSL